MTPPPTVLVVGASRGIGLELVRQYALAGWRVHATTRTPHDPGQLGRLAGDVTVHELEVRNRAHLADLVASLEGEAIDLLVHNAGVMGRGDGRGHRRDEVMAINAEAPIRVVEALLGRVAASAQRKVVLVSSRTGARQGRRGSLGTYGDSKAALNDGFRARAGAWASRGVVAIAVHPGWVRTDMGGPAASLSVEESVTGIRRLVAELDSSHHGRFFTWDGREHPW